MNNGIFSSFDRANSSDNFAGYSANGLIQYESMDGSLPNAPLSYVKPVDGIYHLPVGNDWKIDYNKFVYLIDTTRRRGNYVTGYTQDTDKSFVFFLLGVPGGFGGTAVIDWGDGTIETVSRAAYVDPTLTHYYNSHGLYIIQFYWLNGVPVDGYNVQTNNPSRADTRDGKCIGILSFDSRCTTLYRFVYNFLTCDFVPKTLSRSITTLREAFARSTGRFKNVGLWDTSNITNMNGTFYGFNNNGPPTFNEDLSSWNTSNVTDMGSMFTDNTVFNNGGMPGISGWDTSKVTNMSVMFGCVFRTNGFNQPIGSWNVGNVTNMSRMFGGNDSGGGINSVGNKVFNQDIGSWNVSKVTDMSNMFYGASAFNNASSSGINNWNTSSCTTMSQMFKGATSFNQPIGSWNVSKVQTMSNMFNSTNAFNQDISSWNLAGLNVNTALDSFMNGKTGANSFSTTNYNALLIGWNNNKLIGANGVANWRTDLRPDFGGAKYTAGGAAATARAALVSYGWTITDGGSI